MIMRFQFKAFEVGWQERTGEKTADFNIQNAFFTFCMWGKLGNCYIKIDVS